LGNTNATNPQSTPEGIQIKIIFLLDTKGYAEVAPERLELRQVAPGVVALGMEVEVPLNNPDASPMYDDTTKLRVLQRGFNAFIEYRATLTPVEVPDSGVAPPIPQEVFDVVNKAQADAEAASGVLPDAIQLARVDVKKKSSKTIQ